MSKIDYDKLSEITVKNQEELNNIPLDFKGKIYIEFGTYYDKAIVRNKYYYSVVAWGNSSVEAWGNSSVVARENSSVVARENSSVEAGGNSQIVNRQYNGKIKISGNARIVYMPKNINDFIDYYGIKHTKTKAIFYKAVRKYKDNTYHADYRESFTYEIGKYKTEICNTDIDNKCTYGINISHLNWALDFGSNWDNLAILEVETKILDIVMPTDTDGKVRTSKVKVLREVPLEECGVYGKILAKRRQAND